MATAFDSTGNLYVYGESDAGASGLDFATVKYEIDGNQKWMRRYDGPGNHVPT